MKHNKLRFSALLLAAILLFGITAAAAYEPKHVGEADVLNELGLFLGTSIGYELERSPKRSEALVMLVRLLGKESEAKSCKAEHPFTDVEGKWMEPYVAWAYTNGITKGISDSEYGSDTVADAKMYLTFVLRSLGYSDDAGDFSYATAVEKAAQVGLVEAGAYTNSDFYRDDCVNVSYTALSLALKDNGQKLIDKLVADGAVTKDAAVRCGLIEDATAIDPLAPVIEHTVACVGDSLTFGLMSRNPATQSYPSILAGMDGKYKFTTENYGCSGATVDYKGFSAYADKKEYKNSIKTEADIVIIMLGTNDAFFSTNKDIFPENFKKMVETYINLPQAPKVIVMLPPHLFNMEAFKGSTESLATIVEQEIAVAEELGLDVIDIYTYTEDKPELITDGIHFTVDGYKTLGELVYTELSAILDAEE